MKVAAIERLEVLSEVVWGVGLRWRETRTMFGKQAAKLMSPLAYAFKGSIRKALSKDVDDLKRFIESSSQ
jgi:hypothetical protein